MSKFKKKYRISYLADKFIIMSKKSKTKSDAIEIPKGIIYVAKSLEMISPKLAILFAAKLFTTPIKYKIPKREFEMDSNSVQKKLIIPKINKEIVVYKYGNSLKKVLLVHGWSGRGTQLVKIADSLLEKGYSTISFDAPAHGKSKGNNSIMTEFIASIIEINKVYGPFEYAIGHSLGGMSIINAINQGFKLEKVIIIGSGDIIQDIINDFIYNLGLKPKMAQLLCQHFESKYGEPMNDYSTSVVGKNLETPILIIHDENDSEVNVKAAYQINKAIPNSELMITKQLGHRKILGNDSVIDRIMKFQNL